MIMTLKKTNKKNNLTFFINVYSYNTAQIRICAYIYTLIHKHEKVHSSNISVLQITKNPQFKIQFFSSLVLREKKQKQQ